MTEDFSRFRLNDQKFDAFYRKEIEARILRDKHPVEHPKAVIIAAQPGAGKSDVYRQVRAEFFPDKNAVHIDTDKNRERLPYAKEVQRSFDDKVQSQITHHDANRASTRAINETADRKFNLIAEKTLADPDKAAALCLELKEKGLEVTVVFKATHERDSVRRMFSRYESEKEQDGCGRLPPHEYHDDCYRGLPRTAAKLEQEKLVDRIVVYNDKLEPVHDSRLENGRWTVPNADKAIEKSRSVELTLEEKQQYVADWQTKVFDRMRERGALEPELQQVRDVAGKYVRELGLEPSRSPDLEKQQEPKTDLERLAEIKQHCDRIAPIVEAGKERFDDGTESKRALVNELKEFADSCRSAPDKFCRQHELPLKQFATAVDKLAQDHRSPDTEMAWKLASTVVPALNNNVSLSLTREREVVLERQGPERELGAREDDRPL